MKFLMISALAIAVLIFGCDQGSNKEVKDANESLTEANAEVKDANTNLTDANAEVKDAKANLNEANSTANEAAKEKEAAEWKQFKDQADSSIVNMEKDLKKLNQKIEKAKDKQKLKEDYEKSKKEIDNLKAKLNQRNIEFENNLKRFDDKVSENNKSFKREFTHDMDNLGKSLKDLFTNNVK